MQRVLYGFNMGQPVAEVPLDEKVRSTATDKGFDLKAFAFKAAPEQMRQPRVVRIGLIQNRIVLPTTAPYVDQAKVRRMQVLKHTCTCMVWLLLQVYVLAACSTTFLQAIRERVAQIMDTAGQAGVKVLCMQEAW